MEKVAPNSKFVGHFTEIIWQSKIRALLKVVWWMKNSKQMSFEYIAPPGINKYRMPSPSSGEFLN